MSCAAMLRKLAIPKSKVSAGGFIGLRSPAAFTTTRTPKQRESSNVVSKAIRTICDPFLAIPRTFTTVMHMTSYDWAIKGCECKIVYYTIMVRYRLGINLLRADATIIKRLLTKITQGKCLSRRERQILTQATADIFRLVPGSMFLAVPSIQFVLPLLLRFYPNILSPSFQDKITGQERVMRNLKARTEYAKFLRETAIEMAKVAQNSQSGHIKPLAEEFMRFWVDFGVCRPVCSEDIFRFTKLFSDELTLDHVSRPIMADMCKAMGITPFGTDEYLRFVLREKLKSIKNDDKLIQSKGVEALSESEVRKACRERGIHVAKDMWQQLRDWLDVSLIHAVPSSLLIISRIFTENKKLKPEDAILATLSSLPYDLIYIVGVASLPCNDPRIDKRRKIEALQLQEVIKEEEEQDLSGMTQSIVIQDDVALKEMNALKPEQARERAVNKQEQLLELISDATTVLTSALNVSTECDKLLRVVTKEMNLYSSYQGRKGPDGEREAITGYRVAQEDNSEDAELDVGDNVSSALLNRANGMLQKLEKETDAVAAKTSYRWRVLEREDIFRFTKLFSDELTLDHVSRPFMADVCKAMGITPFGTDEYLRFVLREKLKSIKNDDKLIQSKGVEALSESEVRKACREREIHVAKDMRQQDFLRSCQYSLVGVSSSPIRMERRHFASVPLKRMRTKDMGALTSKLSELKNAPRPHPQPMYPSAYVSRGGLPPYEAVTRYVAIQRGPMVFDLRIDVWPDPFCWMVHGIWPAYVSGDWLVHYKLEEPDSYEFYMMKEQVKKEILSLDHNTKETLHEIWQSYGDYYEDLREQNVDFWAYQKVVHCWDLLNCPQGHYFLMTAKFGKFVRDTLLNWTRKSMYTPNQFYTSKEIRGQLKMLFGVVVHLIVKADDDMDYDPDSTEIPFLYSLCFLIDEDPTQVVWYKFHDHPTGKVKVPQGHLYLLM